MSNAPEGRPFQVRRAAAQFNTPLQRGEERGQFRNRFNGFSPRLTSALEFRATNIRPRAEASDLGRHRRGTSRGEEPANPTASIELEGVDTEQSSRSPGSSTTPAIC